MHSERASAAYRDFTPILLSFPLHRRRVRVFALDPMRRATWTILRILAVWHDALKAQHRLLIEVKRLLLLRCGNFGFWPMLLKKDFEGGLWAVSIQEKHITENIDPRNRGLGFKNCTLIVGRRLFQQHRAVADVQKGKGMMNPKDRELFWEYVAGQATGRKASTPCNFHRKDHYHDEAFASAASAVLFTRRRADGLRLARHLRRREALSA
jgi:hypothetical protein